MHDMRILCVVCAVSATLVASSTASAQETGRDFATGDGTHADVTYRFDVSSGPSGEDPTGSASITGPFGLDLTSIEIECLSVSGNTATFVYSVPLTTGFAHAKVTATDSDLVGDTVGFMVYDEFMPPPTCTPITDFEGNGGQLPGLITGQIVVADARPPPTSKEECKHGGWRNFPIFGNQGDCVSFVATHPAGFEPATSASGGR